MPSIMELKHNRDQQREKLQASIHDAHTLLAQGRQEAGNINGYFTPRLQTNAIAFLKSSSTLPIIYADWRNTGWNHWQTDQQQPLGFLRFGQMAISQSPEVVVPICAPFIGCGRVIIIQNDNGRADQGQQLLQSLLVRTALLLGHQATYTLLDPAGAGGAFPMRRFLPSVQPNSDDVRRDLDVVSAEIRRVIETYIDVATPSFELIPEDMRLNERYRLVFAADFPNKYDRRAIEALQQVAETGPKAGVYTIIHYNPEYELPRDVTIEIFKNAYFIRWHGMVQLEDATLTLDTSPSSAHQDLLFGKLRDAKPVETKLDWERVVGINSSQWWTERAPTKIETPIGKRGNNELLSIYFGEASDGRPCAHGIIGAMTGAGKSNLFHSLISGLAVRYSPEELRLYLVDGKDGVEFQPYMHLPHAEVVSLRTSAELSRSVLKDLVAEKERRNVIFARHKVAGLSGYYELGRPDGIMPRILLIADEYQQMFEDDRDGIASKLLSQLAAQGRAAGIHVLLASQRFGATGMIHKDAIFGNMHLRIAMQMAEDDVRSLTEFGQRGKNLILTTCNLPGKVVVNERAGDDNSNTAGKIAFLSKEHRADILQQITVRAHQLGEASLPRRVVLNGEAQPDLIDNPQLVDLLRDPTWLDDAAMKQFVARPLAEGGLNIDDWFTAESPHVMWIGQEFNVRGQAFVRTRRGIAENVVLAGSNNAVRYGVLAAMLTSLCISTSPQRVRFVIIDRSIPDAQWSATLQQVVEYVFKPLAIGAAMTKTDSEIEPLFQSLVAELERRSNLHEGDRLKQPSIFVVLTDVDRATPLQRKPDRYGDPVDSPTGELLGKLYREGPPLGMHIIISFAVVRSILSVIDERRGLNHFRHRIAFQMSEDESFTFVRSRKAAQLQAGGNKPIGGLYVDIDRDSATLFKPYSIEPDPDSSNGLLADQMQRIGIALRKRKESSR